MKQKPLLLQMSRVFWMSGVVVLPVLAWAESTELSEVKVTATADIQEERRTASAGKLIFDRTELENSNAATVGELLSKLPGTGMFSDAQGGPPRRGQGRGQPRNMPQILVDGQPLPSGSPASTFRLPVEMIERVEIIRNSTPEFQVSSPAGVINIIMRDVPPKPMRNAKITVGTQDGEASAALDGQLSNNVGNLGYLLSGSVSTRPEVGSRESVITTYSGGAVSNRSEEKTTQTGDSNNLTLNPRLTWKIDQGQQLVVSPFFSYSQEQREATTTRTNNTITHEFDENDGERQTARLMSEWRKQGAQGAELSARLMVQTEDEDSEKLIRSTDNLGAITSRQEQTSAQEDEQMLELRGKRVLGEAHLLTGAIEWRNRSSEDSQQRQGSVTTTSLDEQRQVFWLQDEWQISEQHLLTPGFRWQRLDGTITDSQQGQLDNKQTTRAPSLHYLWQPNQQWNMRASIARSDRPASARELNPAVRSASGVNDAGNPDRAGNGQLRAEKQQGIELGLEYFLDKKAGSLGLSVYERRTDDYIQRLTLAENGRWVERPYNVGDARMRGLVFDAKARMDSVSLPNLTLRANAAYSDVEMLNRAANLGAGEGPRKSVNLGLDYELKDYRLTLGGSLSYISAIDRESSATVLQQQGEQQFVTAYALYKYDRQTSIRLMAHNITEDVREESLREYDINGQLERREDDRIPGVASVSVSLERRW